MALALVMAHLSATSRHRVGRNHLSTNIRKIYVETAESITKFMYRELISVILSWWSLMTPWGLLHLRHCFVVRSRSLAEMKIGTFCDPSWKFSCCRNRQLGGWNLLKLTSDLWHHNIWCHRATIRSKLRQRQYLSRISIWRYRSW